VNIVMAVSDASSVPYELQHLWSLGVEEQFYVVWPLVVIALFLIPRVGPVPLLSVLVGIVVATGAMFNFTSIAVGCVAGVAYSHGLVRRIPVALATACLAPMAFLVLTIEHDGHSTPPVLLFTVPTALVLLACVLSQDWWLPRLVDRRPLRWFGKVSYGLYVWHWPLYVALGWKLGLPAALVVATLSYRYVEQPFLRRKRGRTGERPARLPTPRSEPVRVPA
jgi:peptidoglycan/LPS O-acetylase OafA/YrhL